LVDIFGNTSVEYHRYRHKYPSAEIDIDRYEFHDALRRGIGDAISTWQTVRDLFQEKLADSGVSPAARALGGLEQLALHPQVRAAVEQLFRNGHHANAVEDACKALDALVKISSGKHELSGTPLMQTVFSPDKPTLAFNALSNDDEKSEQRGMMF